MSTLHLGAWQSTIPADWRVMKLKQICNIMTSNVDKKTKEGQRTVRLCNYTDVYYNDLIKKEMCFMMSSASSQEIEKFSLVKDDVIITKDSERWDDIAVPAVVYEPLDDVVCGYHLAILRPKSSTVSGRYLLRALQAEGVRDHLHASANGVTRYGLTQLAIANTPIPIPPLATQRAIADFLDRKTAAIDALIASKQRLIELLEEQRAALINQAVTRGLNPDAPMKDSGVPWIGEIPAHWEPVRLKHLVSEQVAGPYGSSLTKSMYTSSGWRVYGQQQVIKDDFTVGDYYISKEKFDDMKRYEVFPGDVLVSVMGTIGCVAVAPEDIEPGIINPRLVRYKPNNSIVLPRYLQSVMLSRSCQERLKVASQGATMDGLNMAILGQLSLPIPSLNEQEEISQYVNKINRRIKDTINLQNRQIKSLGEYRQALITAAVIGQLDVTRPELPQNQQLNLF